MNWKAMAFVGLVAISMTAFAQEKTQGQTQDQTQEQEKEKEKKGPKRGIGLAAGLFLPTDSALREVFGDTWYSLGIQPITFGRPRDWHLTGGISVLTATRHGDRMLAIPVTIGVLKGFDEGGSSVPFIAAAAGPTYYDYSILWDNGGGPQRFAARRIGWNAHVRAGITFSERLQFQVRYDFFSETDGFHFDGLTLSVSWLAFRY